MAHQGTALAHDSNAVGALDWFMSILFSLFSHVFSLQRGNDSMILVASLTWIFIIFFHFNNIPISASLTLLDFLFSP